MLEGMRPEILESWRRIEGSGLRRDADVRAVIGDVERSGALLRAAEPVIEDLALQLAGTDCALLLADRRQQILTRRCGERRVATELDRVAAIPGATYSEEATGTNALSTVFETGTGVLVCGEEHYLDKLHGFSCYGHPIVHPITGVLEGVLDVTGLSAESSGLLRALVVTACRAIEGRLLQASPTNHLRLLGAFQSRAARSRGAVLAFGRDVTLMNDDATRDVDERSLLELRAACASWGSSAEGQRVVRLQRPVNGPPSALISTVDGAPGSFVVELLRTEKTRRRPSHDGGTGARPIATDAATIRERRLRALIAGEPGTGRSTVAAGIGKGLRTVRLVPTTALEDSLDLVAQADDSALLVIDDFDDFEPGHAQALLSRLDDHRRWVVGTVRHERLPPGIASAFPFRVALSPLRQRTQDLPGLARSILEQLDPGAGTITAKAVQCLARYAWPGNLTELTAVLQDALDAAKAQDIDVRHLPAHVVWASSHRLGALEQAEYRVLLESLERQQGNKSKVAAELGIGRNTLYRRMRALGMPR
ncbi:MAG TPA: helix-turn-helix domain-containing protein [Sinomonas sp.]|nr:helix-turn-helix domain-containing protein [Sinomonas sp.]